MLLRRKPRTDEQTTIRTTADPNEVKEWARGRGAVPVLIPPRDTPDPGKLTFAFESDRLDPSVWRLAWAQWLGIFTEQGLALTYRCTDDGGSPSKSFRVHRKTDNGGTYL